MATLENNTYFWQGEHIRIRPMHVNDADLSLEEERSDSEAARFLNSGMDLPKSKRATRTFVARYAEFNNPDERLWAKQLFCAAFSSLANGAGTTNCVYNCI